VTLAGELRVADFGSTSVNALFFWILLGPAQMRNVQLVTASISTQASMLQVLVLKVPALVWLYKYDHILYFTTIFSFHSFIPSFLLPQFRSLVPVISHHCC